MKKVYLILITFLIFISNIKAIDFDLEAKNVYVYNMSEDKIMYEKASKEEIKVASMTKIMTAILVIEKNKDLNREITILDEDLKDMYEYTTCGFQAGDKVTIKDLLYGILLRSGSDAVNAAVRVTAKTEDEFVNMMNDKVKELGLTNTHFSNAIGKDENNYSSVYDIGQIMKYCLKNSIFKEIISTDTYYIEDLKLQINGPLYKMNEKYGIDVSIIDGAKSGYTTLAKHSLVSYKEKDGVIYIVVTAMGESQKSIFQDNYDIYNYFYSNYGYKKYNINFDINIKNGKEKTYNVNENVNLYLQNDYDPSLITYKYKGTNSINFLNKKGDKLGKVSIYYNKEPIKDVDIILSENLKYKVKAYSIPAIIMFVFIFFVVFLLFKKFKKKIRKLIKLKKKKRKAKKVTTKPQNINKQKAIENKVTTFIKEENSLEKNLDIIKTTISVSVFFETLEKINYTTKDKETWEHDFIDRCFENIDFTKIESLQDLYTKLKLYKSKMSQNTINYYNKLFKYCIKEYVDKNKKG